MLPRAFSGHVFIDITIALGVLALGLFYAVKGLATDSWWLLLTGTLGVATVTVVAINIILQNIEAKAWQEWLSQFRAGIFATVGIALTELAVLAGFLSASRFLLLISPLLGIAAGLLAGAMLAKENPRIEAVDEWLGNGVESLLILLFPAYIVGPVLVSIFAALFEDGVGEGMKNLVALLTFLAMLAGVIAALYWLACRFPGWACLMRWGLRIFCFGFFVLVPVAGLTTLLYAALAGPQGWLETLVCSELLLLSAAFVVWSVRKVRREKETDITGGE